MNNEQKRLHTRILALGGLGEVGKNMYCVMHGNEIIITDAGVTFPAGELMGIDYVIPDFTFLKKNEKKINFFAKHVPQLTPLVDGSQVLLFLQSLA